MKVVMIGAGYVGLVSGACFADIGHDVTCVDVDPAKIATLEAGGVPIYEPGLEELVARNVAAGRLHFTTRLADAMPGADAVFICVGTPPRPDDGHADLKYVHAAARDIAASLTGDCVVVTKSTVPVGTGDAVAAILAEAAHGHRAPVVSNPEFLREGAAIGDFMHPDRIVIGTDDGWAAGVMTELYRPLTTDKPERLMVTARRSSELIKYAANAFLATKIAFINEVADLCEAAGADVRDVARGIGLDTRIGEKFLIAGPGYGGSCFPKDTLALLKTAQDFGVDQRIVSATVAANDARKVAMGHRVLRLLGDKAGAGAKVALLGLTFKANTDDMRDSPAIDIARVLGEAGVALSGHDPEGMDNAAALMPHVAMSADAYTAAADADAVVLVTEWAQFKALDLALLRGSMRGELLVDLRHLIEPDAARAVGLRHVPLGRPEPA